jgi:hypothetical protein
MPLLPALMLLIIYGFEIDSCYKNYFEARGKNVKISFFNLFSKKQDVIEIKDENKTDENSN